MFKLGESMIRLDKRVRAVLDFVGGGFLTFFGVDVLRFVSDNSIQLWVNKILEKLFNITITVAKTDGGSSVLMILGGGLLAGAGIYQFLDGYKKITK